MWPIVSRLCVGKHEVYSCIRRMSETSPAQHETNAPRRPERKNSVHTLHHADI